MTVLHFERRYPHPIEKVWDAITQPERLVAWLGEAEIEREQGGDGGAIDWPRWYQDHYPAWQENEGRWAEKLAA